MAKITTEYVLAIVRGVGLVVREIASPFVVAAACLAVVLQGDQTLGDLTTLQWLCVVVAIGAAYGLPSRSTPKRNE